MYRRVLIGLGCVVASCRFGYEIGDSQSSSPGTTELTGGTSASIGPAGSSNVDETPASGGRTSTSMGDSLGNGGAS